MAQLPAVESLQVPDGSLAAALSTLFEPSPALLNSLIPELKPHLPFYSYGALIDESMVIIQTWPAPAKASFIAGHPRIGATSNLSAMSASEQQQSPSLINILNPTPPELLARLARLNALYEARYPGQRFITFVKGRSRAEVAREMEDVLGIKHPLYVDDLPTVESVEPSEPGAAEWNSRLEGAIVAVGQIAKDRLGKLGVE